MLNVIHAQFGDQPQDVLRGAADEVRVGGGQGWGLRLGFGGLRVWGSRPLRLELVLFERN